MKKSIYFYIPPGITLWNFTVIVLWFLHGDLVATLPSSCCAQVHLAMVRYHEAGRFCEKDEQWDQDSAFFHLERAALCEELEAIVALGQCYLQLPHHILPDMSVEVGMHIQTHTHAHTALGCSDEFQQSIEDLPTLPLCIMKHVFSSSSSTLYAYQCHMFNAYCWNLDKIAVLITSAASLAVWSLKQQSITVCAVVGRKPLETRWKDSSFCCRPPRLETGRPWSPWPEPSTPVSTYQLTG